MQAVYGTAQFKSQQLGSTIVTMQWSRKGLTFAILSGKELWNGKASKTAAVAVAAPESIEVGELACSAKLSQRPRKPSIHCPPSKT